MLNNFLFSLEIALPIFIVMGIGYLLKRKGILNDHFIKASNTMIFNVALPIKLFGDMLNTSINQSLDIKLILLAVLWTIGSMILAWITGAILIKDGSQLGAFVHGSFRGNFIYVGFSLMENLTGSIGVKAPLLIAFVIPLYNILAVIALSFTNNTDQAGKKIGILETLKNIIKNPLIIAVLLGIVASEVGFQLPILMTRTMSYFKDLVTPLALVTIGAAFNFTSSSRSLKPSLYSSMLKLVIIPMIAIYAAVLLGFNHEDFLLIYVLFGVPTATVSYIMTTAMNGDSDLASNIIMVTTILSVISMTLFVFAFKTLGFV